MPSFITESVWSIFLVGLFFIIGLGLIHPFHKKLPNVYLAAPLAGIIFSALLGSVFFSVIALPTNQAFGAAASCGIALSCYIVRRFHKVKPSSTINYLLLSILIIIAATLIIDTATIKMGSPAITFVDGTDHAGYAHIADWILNHDVRHPPAASPDLAYQSWPAFMVTSDPRFGSYFYLAIVAYLKNTPSLFCYDNAASVALACGILALAGVYTKKFHSFFILSIAILLSNWFEYAHAGYLGKILSYPSYMLVLGLFFQLHSGSKNNLNSFSGASIILLASGAALLHSGYSALAIIAPSGLMYLSLQFFVTPSTKRNRQTLAGTALILAAACIAAISQTSNLARPAFSPGSTEFPWNYWALLLAGLDITSSGEGIISIYPALAVIFTITAALATLYISKIRINTPAIATILGPAIFFALLLVSDNKWHAYQLIGTPFIFLLCAICLLADELPNHMQTLSLLLIATAATLLFIRIPRIESALQRYCLNGVEMIKDNQYRLKDIDEIAQAIGNQPLEIDISNPQDALVALLELGRRNIYITWSDNGWKTITGYRNWVQPLPRIQPTLRLISAKSENFEEKNVILQRHQFALLRTSKNTSHATDQN